MEVSPERSSASPEGLIVSSIGPHIISLQGLRLHRLSKLLLEGLSGSLGGTKLINHI